MYTVILQTTFFILFSLYDHCIALEGDTPAPSLSSYPSLPLSSCEDDPASDPAPQEDPMFTFLTSRNAALQELKSLQEKVQQGDQAALQKAKELRKKYKISDKHLGIESHQWSQDPEKVEKLPIEQQLQAMQNVDPNNRYAVPLDTREQILKYELSKVPTDDIVARRKREFELSPILALCLFPLTDSQQDGIDNLPKYTQQLKIMKQNLPILYDLLDLKMKDKKRKSDTDSHDPKRQRVDEDSNKDVDDIKAKISKTETKMEELKKTIKARHKSIKRLDAKDGRDVV